MGIVLLLEVAPVASQSAANFGTLTLDSNKTSGTLSGAIGGSTSLPAIVSNNDYHGKKCLGFGDPSPDHQLVLKQPFAKLQLKVNSGGSDTTLVIQGPNGTVRCGDDTGANKDASITDSDWPAGSYKIWVGSSTPGTRRDYTLSVRSL